MEVFKINNLVFDYMDMRCIEVLKESYDIINSSLKLETLNNDKSYFYKISDLIKAMISKFEKRNIHDEMINSISNTLLDLDNFEINTYLEALISFLDRIEILGNNIATQNDNTLGKEFNINIHSRKSDDQLNFKFIKTENGWRICDNEMNKWTEASKSGEDILYFIIKRHSINYPHDLGGYLKWLWDISTFYNLTENEVAEEFDELSKWINLCNNYSPNTRLGGYK